MPIPHQAGVIIEDFNEVPADIRGPAERAAKKAAKKETRHVELAFARPETAEEAGHRAGLACFSPIIESAHAHGVTPEEAAFYTLCAGRFGPEEGGLEQRVALDCEAFFSPTLPAVVLRADLDRGHWQNQENMPLEWLVAHLVAEAYRRALWHYRGLERMAKRGKLKSLDRDTDCRIYARDLVGSDLSSW